MNTYIKFAELTVGDKVVHYGGAVPVCSVLELNETSAKVGITEECYDWYYVKELEQDWRKYTLVD
jgi:hypothetical protein